ncbi:MULTISPECIES: pilus assembly protein N-terminal domain-containing protein [unclassified Roseitalea]|uniref:pilus assembly protein N-terminal domain-containing protein n=1 Tax=unclassified Roseitalea TaxID=2639107 RepID=UPI00273F7CEC|nr:MULTISPECIES: pilus assembly protein N-terminal domain-containing protein [unclassified Roseitalea]
MALRLAGIVAGLFSLALVAGQAATASANEHEPAGIQVVLNHAKVIKLSRPASTIVIGNPEVADATVQDANTIVLTGQGFGRTNLVILDEAGTPIFDEKIAVTRDQAATLRIYRRANIETLSCEPHCEAAYLTEAEKESLQERARVNAMFGE